MPRGGYKNFRKRPALNKNTSKNKLKWVKSSDEGHKESDNNEEEAEELTQYEQLLQTFRNNEPNSIKDAKFNDDDDDDDDDDDEDFTKNNNDKHNDDENNDDKHNDEDRFNEVIKNDADDNDDDADDNDDDADDNDDDADDNDNTDEEEEVSKLGGDDDDRTTAGKQTDAYLEHLSCHLDHLVAEVLLNKPTWVSQPLQNKWMGGMTYHASTLSKPLPPLFIHDNPSIKSLNSVYKNLATCNKKFLPSLSAETAAPFTPFQENLFSIIDNYLDLHMSGGGAGDDEVKVAYCVHVLRHLLKSSREVLKNNEKLKSKSAEEIRDQGLTRTKVLIIVPTRGHAHKIISIIIALLYSDKLHVTNKERFMEEYGCGNDLVKKGLKPADYEATFEGNNDDNFKLGVVVRKKTLKLFSDFYASDLIVASPLALKHVIKPNNTTSGHWDFLSSVEVLIIDCMHVLLMQNWSNVMLVVNHLNKRLVKNHGTDLSRVRMACLNGWSSLYRQNILISPYQTAEFKSIFNKHCTNIEGKIQIEASVLHGSISNVVSTLPQTFRKFEVSKVAQVSLSRFSFFVKNILPDYLSNPSTNILLFIPSYYDFVRLRNHFKKQDISFASISDYTEEKDVQKYRQQFFVSNFKFLLFTERFHFYHRYQIKGINHLIFYDLPHNGHFYSEFCNMMGMLHSKRSSHHSCLALFCKYDLLKLTSVLGTNRAQRLVVSDKPVHLFMSSDS